MSFKNRIKLQPSVPTLILTGMLMPAGAALADSTDASLNGYSGIASIFQVGSSAVDSTSSGLDGSTTDTSTTSTDTTGTGGDTSGGTDTSGSLTGGLVIDPIPVDPIYPIDGGYIPNNYSYQYTIASNSLGDSIGSSNSFQDVIAADGSDTYTFSQSSYFQASDASAAPVILADPNDDGSGVIATYATGISDNDVVVGWDVLGDGNQSIFEYNVASNTYVDLAAPLSGDFIGASSFQADGVSSNGEFIIGQFTNAGNNTEGFVYDTVTGTWTVINETADVTGYDPLTNPYEFTSTSSVDSNGNVTGWYQDANGNSHEYVFNALTGEFINNNLDDPSNSLSSGGVISVGGSGPVIYYPIYQTLVDGVSTPLTTAGISLAPAAAVPLPGAFWLMASAVAGIGWSGRRKAARHQA